MSNVISQQSATNTSSALKIPVLGQGCGGGQIHNAEELARRVDSLVHGIECGLSFLDTAEAYHDGASEIAVGRAIQGRRDKVFLATKVSPHHLTAAEVIRAAERSLERLGTNHIDLYQIHWSNPQVPIEETLTAIQQLIDSGKVRAVGVCNFSNKEIRAALSVRGVDPIVSVQSEYNLFDRSVERSLWPTWLTEPNRTFIAYSPLEQGSLAGSEEARGALQKIADRHGATPAQVALAWIISHPGVSAIPRSTSKNHIEENARALEVQLSRLDIDEINANFSPTPLTVPVDRIRVVTDGLDNRAVYQTKEQALRNELKMTPSPAELASDISGGEFLKPVRVRPTTDTSGRYDYDLIEGRLRYWAWTIAFDSKRPIHVLVRKG
jgi:aryl-alcohol dehydrogenase-like predicted oxidoreductase